MNEQMTKTLLIQTLKRRRAEFDAVIGRVPEEDLTRTGVQGEWSVRDIIAHLSYYENWMADQLNEQLRGEDYQPTELDMTYFDERNIRIHEMMRDLSLSDVLAASREGYQRIIEAVEAHSETFLTEPQQFSGLPEPILVWKMLASEVYGSLSGTHPVYREVVGGWNIERRAPRETVASIGSL